LRKALLLIMSNESILEACSFFVLPKRELWISTDLNEAYSYEVISDHDSRWLNERLADRPPAREFWFYFTVAPENADEVCREILAEIRLPGLQPIVRTPTDSVENLHRDLRRPSL
jgi:hypothetical protein